MPEMVTDFDPTVCLICHGEAELQCECGRSYCAQLFDRLKRSGVTDCDCGKPW